MQNSPEHRGDVHGLGQVAVHARGHGPFHVFPVGVGGHGDDRHQAGVDAVQSPDFSRGFIAVHFRHLDVHENKIIIVFGRGREHVHPFQAVFRCVNRGPGAGQEFLHNHAVDFNVFHQQDAHAFQVDGIHGLEAALFAHPPFFQGQLEAEGRAAAGLTGHADIAAHGLEQIFADGQPQARAAKARGDFGVGLLKGHEQPALLLLGHADAVVPHGKTQGDFISRIPQQLYGKADAAPGIGEFDGIAQQIDEHLVEPELVAHDHQSPRIAYVRAELNVFFPAAGQNDVGNFVKGLAQVKSFVGQFHFAGLDFGHVQNVVENAQQMAGGGNDATDGRNGFFVAGGGFFGNFGHADDRVERGADLVTHFGQKGAFGLGGDARLKLRGFPLADLDLQIAGALIHQDFQLFAHDAVPEKVEPDKTEENKQKGQADQQQVHPGFGQLGGIVKDLAEPAFGDHVCFDEILGLAHNGTQCFFIFVKAELGLNGVIQGDVDLVARFFAVVGLAEQQRLGGQHQGYFIPFQGFEGLVGRVVDHGFVVRKPFVVHFLVSRAPGHAHFLTHDLVDLQVGEGRFGNKGVVSDAERLVRPEKIALARIRVHEFRNQRGLTAFQAGQQFLPGRAALVDGFETQAGQLGNGRQDVRDNALKMPGLAVEEAYRIVVAFQNHGDGVARQRGAFYVIPLHRRE